MSGMTMSTPRSSCSGNINPASMTIISSPKRKASIFMPNSPNPPSGMAHNDVWLKSFRLSRSVLAAGDPFVFLGDTESYHIERLEAVGPSRSIEFLIDGYRSSPSKPRRKDDDIAELLASAAGK